MDQLFIIILSILYTITYGQDNIVFPENPGQQLDNTNKMGKVPFYAPGKCPENQLLWPGNQKDEWYCDCGPGFIYYPPKDGCFPAFRRGPCPLGQHLILKSDSGIPKCLKNPCNDGFAIFNGKCYELDKPNGPCKPIELGGGIFGVNVTTLTVECLKGTDRLGIVYTSIKRVCPTGFIADKHNECRENYNV